MMKTRVNGHACMDPKLAQANHFSFSGLHIAGNTSNPLGSKVTPVTVAQIPGLNTLGISTVRIDYAPWGVIPPHMHPRATEILTVLDGRLFVGFVTSNPANRLISKVLQKGDVFVFPVGLVHFQRNVGYGNAVSISSLSSQNPGVITVANAVFGSNPPIANDVLAKAFQVEKTIEMANHIMLLSLLAITCALAIAFEPSPLQDFCVADSASSARINGLACMDSKLVEASHFSFSGFHIAGNTSNPLGSKATPATVAQIPGLNTLGISTVRIDYAPWGVIPPHTHPRATEILTVLDGCLYVGFVTSNPDNRLITKVLQKGDVFVFPVGLVHFQRNVGYGNAVSMSSLSSQNPGVINVANAVFGSNPLIAGDVLAKAFQLDKTTIARLQAQFN
ncbi:hypothetical protein L1049_010304 [Liquidambar formosana]|uniref:Cupin type-1 domain-containing protein n=1 Tax=Liquidambar formosana TaxID=63359 RepID=A0AAP0R1S8_LIQFO